MKKIFFIFFFFAVSALPFLFPAETLALTNYRAAISSLQNSGVPSSLYVNTPYVFNTVIHVNNTIPVYINNNGVRDVFGINLYRINQSGGRTLNNPNDQSITISWLGNNRARGNDVQQEYGNNGIVFPGGHTRWDDFQCGEQWLRRAETGDDIRISCTFTPKVTGFYQVDINSYYYYSTWAKDCYHGWCGPIGGYFIKVIEKPQQNGLCGTRPADARNSGKQIVANYDSGRHEIPGEPNDIHTGADIVLRADNTGSFEQCFYGTSPSEGMHGDRSIWKVAASSVCQAGYFRIPQPNPQWGDYLNANTDYCVQTTAFPYSGN